MAVVGAIATAKIQGADVDIPTLAAARADFNTWLLSDDDGDDSDDSDDAILKRALGLGKG